MKKPSGLSIDHRKAVIVIITDEGEQAVEIASHIEKHVRLTGGTASELGSTEDGRDRQFEHHLNSYYDRVLAVLRGADSIRIFGPGEAKGELRKRLEHEGLHGHVLAVETVDKMTDRQIAAKVREYGMTRREPQGPW
jgi:DNA-binding transcriptional ArsR family regulator